MNNSSEPSQDDVIRSWHERANAYNRLIERWPIFTNMVNRLLEFIPKEFDGHALDIGGGSGLLAEHLLDKYPKSRVTIVEPAEKMRVLASRRLGNRIEIRDALSDKLDTLDLIADAALCSASFHLMNEETTLPSVSSALKKGSVFAVNLWGHSFDKAVALNKKVDWMQFIDQALREFGQLPMHSPKAIALRIKSEEELRKIGMTCGLHLLETNIVLTEIETQFNIEFAAMNNNFLHQVEKDIRKKIINRALNLCSGVDTISSVDICFEKI